MTKELFGNQALLVTPMLEDGSIDYDGLRNVIDYVIDGGAHGVLVMGSTGENFTMSAEERKEVMKVSAEHVAGRVTLSFGTGDSGSALAASHTAYAQEVGADFVLVPPPYYSPVAVNTGEGVYRHFKMIADAAPKTTIMLYDGGSGLEVPLDTMRRLYADTPNVRSVKLNLPNPLKIKSIQDVGMTAFCGTDRMTMLMLGYGSDGHTIGIGSIMPKETSMIYDLWKAGEHEKARDVYYDRMLPFINVTLAWTPTYIAAFKLILHWKGIIKSPTVRTPVMPLDPVREAELKAVAKRLSLI